MIKVKPVHEELSDIGHRLIGKKCTATPEGVALQLKLMKEQPWQDVVEAHALDDVPLTERKRRWH